MWSCSITTATDSSMFWSLSFWPTSSCVCPTQRCSWPMLSKHWLTANAAQNRSKREPRTSCRDEMLQNLFSPLIRTYLNIFEHYLAFGHQIWTLNVLGCVISKKLAMSWPCVPRRLRSFPADLQALTKDLYGPIWSEGKIWICNVNKDSTSVHNTRCKFALRPNLLFQSFWNNGPTVSW